MSKPIKMVGTTRPVDRSKLYKVANIPVMIGGDAKTLLAYLGETKVYFVIYLEQPVCFVLPDGKKVISTAISYESKGGNLAKASLRFLTKNNGEDAFRALKEYLAGEKTDRVAGERVLSARGIFVKAIWRPMRGANSKVIGLEIEFSPQKGTRKSSDTETKESRPPSIEKMLHNLEESIPKK